MNKITEKISGIVERVTFFSEQSGWSVLKVSLFNRPGQIVTVTVHQAKVFAGATVEFEGAWETHRQYGEQFKAYKMNEKKPSSAAALEKYLGSGLIYGVGPKTAKKIVNHFKEKTLDIFENNISDLMQVQGIAKAKLQTISKSWQEHREIRNVMMFLQTHGISTLFAVKIYKEYGNKAISIVNDNPYQLSNDIYGIGFLSADNIAKSLGICANDPKRIKAAIKHVLAQSRDEGHCFLKLFQVQEGIEALLSQSYNEEVVLYLEEMRQEFKIMSRVITENENENENNQKVTCYYSKTLYYDEEFVGKKVNFFLSQKYCLDQDRIKSWIDKFNQNEKFPLSEEQTKCVKHIVANSISILTGGPGCGKTTTTKSIVKLLVAMGSKVILCAPTGRAAQRMEEVIGLEASTIHRLLTWSPASGGFLKNEDDQIDGDFVIVDECSMLDISLTASLFKAIDHTRTKILLIGDKDQLPSVGAGNVFKDLINSSKIPVYRLTQIFRQAKESQIIKCAYEVNRGEMPIIDSPFRNPSLWKSGNDTFFIDSEEATKLELTFLKRVKSVLKNEINRDGSSLIETNNKKNGAGKQDFQSIVPDFEEGKYLCAKLDKEEFEKLKNGKITQNIFSIPEKFKHVKLDSLLNKNILIDELKEVIKNIHPFSSLHFGIMASDMIVTLYKTTIPKYLGTNTEVQILTPMTRGSMGTIALNKKIQNECNPRSEYVKEIVIGDRIFRCNDRVIQKRNNYDLEVFNGDIGIIVDISLEEMQLSVLYPSKKGVTVIYNKENFIELDLAYAITIHKSQGSEFDSVIIPVTTQHFKLLSRNLIYTGLTRAKKNLIFIGTRKALAMAVRNIDNRKRQTYLSKLIK